MAVVLYEVAEFGDGGVLGVVVQVDLPDCQGFLVLLIPHEEEELGGGRSTSWLSALPCISFLTWSGETSCGFLANMFYSK